MSDVFRQWRSRASRKGAMSVLVLLFFGIATVAGPAAAWAQQSLTVALYPWVPRPAQFQTVLQQEWAKVEPGVTLNFVPDGQWDGGYDKDPLPAWDVFVFDAMFFEYFRSKNWLAEMQPGEIQNLGDFVSYAINGVKVGNSYFAVPLLGCGDILFYQKSDAAMAAATTLSQVRTSLSQCTYTSQIPPDRRGLMVDLAGGTTKASFYLQAAHALNGTMPPPLPWNQSQVNTQAVTNIRSLMAMASYWNVSDGKLPDYQRAAWMSQGYGRAMIGFTESMSKMDDAMRAGIAFKPMPLSDTPHQPLFYSDVIGINAATVANGKRALAVKLANVMAAADTVVATFGPDAGNPVPQYLMAARTSVFQRLGSQFPLYKDMQALITNNNPAMFKLSDQSRAWLTQVKQDDMLGKDIVAGYSCGCDYPSPSTIMDNADAPSKCRLACADYGGWNGQWSNAIPGTSGSVCGCNACPVSASR